MIRLLIILVLLLGAISGGWYFATGRTIPEQIEYVKFTFTESTSSETASNTADSASKLGKVLKNNFDEAQDVYENGAKYN